MLDLIESEPKLGDTSILFFYSVQQLINARHMPLAVSLNLLTLAGTAVNWLALGLWKLISLTLAGLTSFFICFQRHSQEVTAGLSVLPILTYNSTFNSTAAAWLQHDPKLQ